MRFKLMVLSILAASLLVVGVSPAAAQPDGGNSSRQLGLVNVSTGDIELLNNVNLAVAANVLATVCDLNVPIAVLATQVIGTDGVTRCETTSSPITIEQA